jgi:hypothetical protein
VSKSRRRLLSSNENARLRLTTIQAQIGARLEMRWLWYQLESIIEQEAVDKVSNSIMEMHDLRNEACVKGHKQPSFKTTFIFTDNNELDEIVPRIDYNSILATPNCCKSIRMKLSWYSQLNEM